MTVAGDLSDVTEVSYPPLGALLPFVVGLSVIRVPGTDWLLAGFGLAALAASRRPHRRILGLASVYVACIATSLIATMADGSSSGFVTTYVWPAVGQLMFVLGTASLDAPSRQVRRLAVGLTGGLVAVWLIGLAEIVTGFKLIRVLAPTTTSNQLAESSRWVTASVFTNYNDFCLALAILSVLALSHILFVPSAHPRVRIVTWFTYGSSLGLVAVMGSRGALAAGLAGSLAVAILAIRAVRPQLVTPGRLAIGLALATPPGLFIWSSPYVQDHSTGIREAIVSNSLDLWQSDAFSAVFGYGSSSSYSQISAQAYPDTLMDPHNLMLEFALNFGLTGLCLVSLWWFVTVARVALDATATLGWDDVAFRALAVLLPIMGVVPSRFLSYAYIPVIGAACALTWSRKSPGIGSTRP